jgi:hypothetical protein
MSPVRTFILLLTLLLAGVVSPATGSAAPGNKGCNSPGRGCGMPGCDQPGHRCTTPGERRPYGDYGCNQESGWYGARREIATEQQARAVLHNYFAKRNLVIGTLKELPMFFEAEIFNSSGKVVDKVIVHKRSGRIRSIY